MADLRTRFIEDYAGGLLNIARQELSSTGEVLAQDGFVGSTTLFVEDGRGVKSGLRLGSSLAECIDPTTEIGLLNVRTADRTYAKIRDLKSFATAVASAQGALSDSVATSLTNLEGAFESLETDVETYRTQLTELIDNTDLGVGNLTLRVDSTESSIGRIEGTLSRVQSDSGGNVIFSGTGFIDVPTGTTNQRPDSPNNGMIRYNTTLSGFEGYSTDWELLRGDAANINFEQAGTTAVTRTVESKLRETVSVLDFIPVAEHAAIRAGTSTYDCKPGIQAAITYLSTLFGRGKLFFPDGRYQVNSVITLPTGITLEGPVAPWTDVSGITWNSGAVLYKAHNGDCIQAGIGSQVVGVAIKNLAIQSNSTTYPSGAGINYGKVVEARLDGVNVFRVGGDGIIFGDNSTDTWHSYMNDCYVNNPGGRAFVIGTKWFRGKNIRSDNGTVACELLTGAQEITLEAFHFEGWSQNALKISGGNIQTTGRCISANTFAGSSAVHVDFMNVSGAFITTLRGVHFFGASSRAVRLNGTQNVLVSVEDCSIESAAVGVDVNGGDNCSIRNNSFYQCGYAFRQNASGLIFTGNTTALTVNAQVGEFVAGTNSSYTNNRLDKQLNSSGLILSSNTNTASGNKGWVTKSGGTTAAVTSGTAVPHGLPGQPTEVQATPTTGGWTSFHIGSDATNLYFNHVGISDVQYHWTARLACDRQS